MFGVRGNHFLMRLHTESWTVLSILVFAFLSSLSISEFFRFHQLPIITSFRLCVLLSSSVCYYFQPTHHLVLIGKASSVLSWFALGVSGSVPCRFRRPNRICRWWLTCYCHLWSWFHWNESPSVWISLRLPVTCSRRPLLSMISLCGGYIPTGASSLKGLRWSDNQSFLLCPDF